MTIDIETRKDIDRLYRKLGGFDQRMGTVEERVHFMAGEYVSHGVLKHVQDSFQRDLEASERALAETIGFVEQGAKSRINNLDDELHNVDHLLSERMDRLEADIKAMKEPEYPRRVTMDRKNVQTHLYCNLIDTLCIPIYKAERSDYQTAVASIIHEVSAMTADLICGEDWTMPVPEAIVHPDIPEVDDALADSVATWGHTKAAYDRMQQGRKRFGEEVTDWTLAGYASIGAIAYERERHITVTDEDVCVLWTNFLNNCTQEDVRKGLEAFVGRVNSRRSKK